MIFWPHMQLVVFWQDRSVRKHGAQLVGSWVSNFMFRRIMNSLIFVIFNEFRCTRNPRCCPGSPQILSSIIWNNVFPKLVPPIFQNLISSNLFVRIIPGLLTSAQPRIALVWVIWWATAHLNLIHDHDHRVWSSPLLHKLWKWNTSTEIVLVR